MIEPLDALRALLDGLRSRGIDTVPTSLAEVTREQAAAWGEAMREASIGDKFLIRCTVPSDLSEVVFDSARELLGGPAAASCTIVHSAANATEARRIAERVSAGRVEVPSPLLRHRFGWAVTCDAGCVWSEGIP